MKPVCFGPESVEPVERRPVMPRDPASVNSVLAAQVLGGGPLSRLADRWSSEFLDCVREAFFELLSIEQAEALKELIERGEDKLAIFLTDEMTVRRVKAAIRGLPDPLATHCRGCGRSYYPETKES